VWCHGAKRCEAKGSLLRFLTSEGRVEKKDTCPGGEKKKGLTKKKGRERGVGGN